MSDPLPAQRPPRLNAQVVLADAADALFSLERGLPWTIWQLLRRPGWTIRRYLDWRDERLIRPFRLTLVVLAMTALALHLLGWSAEFTEGFVAGLTDDSDVGPDGAARGAMALLARFDLALLLCWIPACVTSLHFAYRDLQLNLAEAMVFALYTMVQWLLLGFFSLLLLSVFTSPEGLTGIAVLLLVQALCLSRSAAGLDPRPRWIWPRAIGFALLTQGLLGFWLLISAFLAMALGAMV